MNILVTGAKGFIGTNLIAHLKQNSNYRIISIDIDNSGEELTKGVCEADFIFHLAGINRPKDDSEFFTGNTDLTNQIITILQSNRKKTPVLLSSSIQADLDNSYGVSKKRAEDALREYQDKGGVAYIYRLSNAFGKWGRPNYNSVVATFCYNIANGKSITVSDRSKAIDFVYIDDIVREFASVIENPKPDGLPYFTVEPQHIVTLGELEDLLNGFKGIRKSLQVPDFSNPFVKKLYATYLSYLPIGEFSYPMELKSDERGNLFELIKSNSFGQIFVSSTKPGITRGNHFHHTKAEKFCVISGEAEIKFRHIIEGELITYKVNGVMPEVVDIPPGYTHSITNIGTNELITLFWANEKFNPDHPDTYAESVL